MENLVKSGDLLVLLPPLFAHHAVPDFSFQDSDLNPCDTLQSDTNLNVTAQSTVRGSIVGCYLC